MQNLLMNYREVAPDNMREWKIIRKVFRYLSDENNSLSVNFTIVDRVFRWYSIITIFYLLVFSGISAFMTSVKNVNMFITSLYFFFSFISWLAALFVAVTSEPIFQAERMKKFLEKDKPKRTLPQWLQSVLTLFKSIVWMPKFNIQNSEVPLQKMAHAEELFNQKGQNH